MQSSGWRLTGVLLLGVMVALLSPTSGSAEAPQVDPEAAASLRIALERIARAPRFAYRAETASDVLLPSGQMVQFPGVLEVAVRRPDRLRATFDGEQRSTRSWYDGETFTLLDGGKNVYARWPAPKRLDELLTSLREQFGFTPPLTHLLRENIATSAFAKVTAGFTAGSGVIGGVRCRHLVFSGEKTDWQVWVSEGAEPVLKRLVVSQKGAPAAPRYVATFLAWDFSPSLTDADFTFTPPPGALEGDFEPQRR